MKSACTIEVYLNGGWHAVASVETIDSRRGVEGALHIGYDIGHALDYPGSRGAAALSWTLPVSMDAFRSRQWPGFLVDLLPQGYGRQELLRQLGLAERTGHAADWSLLLHGAGNPIGNVRVREAYEWLAEHSRQPSSGFSREEVASRGEHFTEHLASHGLFIAGSSGIQGEWPKILLTEDATGSLHLDHNLPDPLARRHWLVKFARGNDARLNQILTLESKYMALAQRLGLRVHGDLELQGRALFIPRFDREIDASGRVLRHAQESLYALCDKGGFGATVTHDEACHWLAQACTHPETEIVEYLKRDIANVVLGDKDNHGRNTALQRRADGVIRLSPRFDFAPMMLHPDGIARRTRWSETDFGHPDWRKVVDLTSESSHIDPDRLLQPLREYARLVAQLPEWMRELDVDREVIEMVSPSIRAAVAQLESL